MARKTNDEFKDMSIKEMDEYTNDHPSEAIRASKLLGAAAGQQVQKYFVYQAQRVMKMGTPKQLSEE
ncbi:hypothetical protein [Cohnella yongneupensis]|uniref:Small, acid-soluble spore protein, alpha/beta type n=1 Tax=Cohnella yongneupensis TaxID=425006 RepID=A0ABW0R3V1_9BACL